MLVSVSEYREFDPAPLVSDAVLASLLAAEEAYVDRVVGPIGPKTKVVTGGTRGLVAPNGTIDLIEVSYDGVTWATAPDWIVVEGIVRRVDRAFWPPLVRLTYTVDPRIEQRKAAIRLLVRESLRGDNQEEIRIGEWSERYRQKAPRARILRSVGLIDEVIIR
jgi:hypothetical protein